MNWIPCLKNKDSWITKCPLYFIQCKFGISRCKVVNVSYPLTIILRPNIEGLLSDSYRLNDIVKEASQLAEAVSSKVRLLDVAKVSHFDYT